MLVARKELVRCIIQDQNKPTLCNLPVDPLDAVGSAMAHVDEEITDLAKEIILHTLVSPDMLGFMIAKFLTVLR
jgi:hypothetical protein